MYSLQDISEPERLTKDAILLRISEEDIMRKYLGFDYVVNKTYSSPFRKDDNPSFALYYTKDGGLRFKDFNGLQGTCFDLVLHIYGLENFLQSLQMINKDFDLKIGSYTYVEKKELIPYKPKVLPRRERLIQFKPQVWTKTDAQYWTSYGITSKTLKHFNVFSAKYVFLDKELVLRYTVNNPIYAYKFNKHVKIYRPLADKTNFKWMGNVDENDLQGFDQLEENLTNTLVITKSLKDVMVLYELGYQAVAPQSENTRSQFELIGEIIKDFDKIIILYDNDEAGKNGAQELQNFIGPKAIQVFIEEKDCKDISDYTEKYNIEKSGVLIKNLING